MAQSLAIWQPLLLCDEGATLGAALAQLVGLAFAMLKSMLKRTK